MNSECESCRGVMQWRFLSAMGKRRESGGSLSLTLGGVGWEGEGAVAHLSPSSLYGGLDLEDGVALKI